MHRQGKAGIEIHKELPGHPAAVPQRQVARNEEQERQFLQRAQTVHGIRIRGKRRRMVRPGMQRLLLQLLPDERNLCEKTLPPKRLGHDPSREHRQLPGTPARKIGHERPHRHFDAGRHNRRICHYPPPERQGPHFDRPPDSFGIGIGRLQRFASGLRFQGDAESRSREGAARRNQPPRRPDRTHGGHRLLPRPGARWETRVLLPDPAKCQLVRNSRAGTQLRGTAGRFRNLPDTGGNGSIGRKRFRAVFGHGAQPLARMRRRAPLIGALHVLHHALPIFRQGNPRTQLKHSSMAGTGEKPPADLVTHPNQPQ